MLNKKASAFVCINNDICMCYTDVVVVKEHKDPS